MKRKILPIAFGISIVLNLVLLIVIGIGQVGRAASEYYYEDFTGSVLRESARQIEAGNAARVVEVLKQIQGRPTYTDLIAILGRLNPERINGPEHPKDAPAR